MHAPEHRRSYRAAARAAMFALVAPAALIVALAMTAALDGWADAFRHAVFVMLLIFALADVLVLTIDFIPFTRPYRPGHAKLKSRWPLYLFGAYGFSYGLVHIELMALGSDYAFGALLGATAVAIAVLELGGRKAAMKWSVDPDEGLADDSGGITVLDIGAVVRGAV